MNYELAKQLKDAGFPQTGELKDFPWVDEPGYSEKPYAGNGYMNIKLGIPTLSELIEACGEKFEGLQHGQLLKEEDGTFLWYAASYNDVIKNGSTPEEAVANLWLELNGKEVDNP